MSEPNTLDEQVSHILANVAMPVVPEDHRRIRHAKQQLKTLFTEHGKEVKKQATITALKLAVMNIKASISPKYAIQALEQTIAQLKRNKGEDNE